MIYLQEALDAKSAMDFGLVTKITSGDKELKTHCDKVLSSSSEVSFVLFSPFFERVTLDASRIKHEILLEEQF